MGKNICGIQQVGIGVKNAKEAWEWYIKVFGMDINVFEDTATARLMKHYTNGLECNRYAALAMNMEGGGGFEIWQHTQYIPKAPVFDLKLGDTGIFITKMKCRNVKEAFDGHRAMGVNILGEISVDPLGNRHYYLTDPYFNIFEIIDDQYVFLKQKSLTGGVSGIVAGVSDIGEAQKVYSDILEYDEVVYDQSGQFEDFTLLPGGNEKYRRVLLKHKPRTGPFSKILGPTQIELVQPLERKPDKIFRDRIWGELGYIHICFDIMGMNLLKKECEQKGFPFTVNSADRFDMGNAAGHFAYISDPDSTPIEFVETHKLPIIQKLGWYLNVKNRNPEKPLPDWMLKTMQFNRIKN